MTGPPSLARRLAAMLASEGLEHEEVEPGRFVVVLPGNAKLRTTVSLAVYQNDIDENINFTVVVPDQAVIHSGERAVVVVRKSESLFEPREVELGNAGRGEQEILAGLDPGEEIVTSSQFLIDSESNLRAAISQLLGPDTDADAMPAMQHQH